MNPTYPCDPTKNIMCNKGSCFINDGPCHLTDNPANAVTIDLIDFGIAYMPDRAHETDAGADVFALYDVTIEPGECHKMTLDFGMDIPSHFAAYIEPKGSTGMLGLMPVSNPIDAGYRGPVNVVLWNVSKEPRTITRGMKIAQLVVKPVVIRNFTIKQPAEVSDTPRGTGSYGSSGTHHE